MSGRAQHDALLARLDGLGATYRLLSHAECRTSEESHRARASQGEPEAVGAKALLVRQTQEACFALIVLPGFSRLDSKRVRKTLGSFRFASVDELADCTGGLVPGSIPPFAALFHPQVQVTYLDAAILQTSKVGFNAAVLDASIVMPTSEYMRVLGPYEVLS